MVHKIEDVINRGMCIGCGACRAATNGAISIRLTERRMYEASLDGVSEIDRRKGSSVCPFSDESPNEDDLGAPSGDTSVTADPKLGQVTSTFAGRVEDNEYLMGSSSGGLTSWLVSKLIEKGFADAVIKVGQSSPLPNELVHYSVVENENVKADRKSHYYASTLADALEQIREDDRRFVLVGVPCFIRAARALCEAEPKYADKLVYFVGLVCGHFKTQSFPEALAWQVGIHPDELAEADFRVKNFNRPSNQYDFGAKCRNSDEWKFGQVHSLVGGNWGHNAFQPEACNFCDDVVGETADVSFGDAWLPEYTNDPRGTNVVISRNVQVDQLLKSGASSGELTIDNLSLERAIKSQAGGFRHRREGLAVRLADDQRAGKSIPKKRVEPDLSVVTARRRKLIRQRRKMAVESQKLFNQALEKDDLKVFLSGMDAEISRYRRLEAPRVKRVLRIVKRRYMKLKVSKLH